MKELHEKKGLRLTSPEIPYSSVIDNGKEIVINSREWRKRYG